MPSASALAYARENILTWWENAWLIDPTLRTRFDREAMAALTVGIGASTEDIFAALEWRRLRLRQDQQVQEWTGLRSIEDTSTPSNPGAPGVSCQIPRITSQSAKWCCVIAWGCFRIKTLSIGEQIISVYQLAKLQGGSSHLAVCT